jgi:hypothetical protein
LLDLQEAIGRQSLHPWVSYLTLMSRGRPTTSFHLPFKLDYGLSGEYILSTSTRQARETKH